MAPHVLFFLLLVGAGLLVEGVPPRATVTNEDIRDAILQVVNVVRATEDKLERHEYRERALGENLRKAIISIDKRIKLLDPFKGTVGRIDERLATVETILMQKDERERAQLQKTADAVEDIKRNLPQVVEKLKNDILSKISSTKAPPPPKDVVTKKDFDKLQKDLLDKLNSVVKSINKMENDLSKVKDENKNLQTLNNNSAASLEKVKRQLDTSEGLLAKYENKLAEYNNKIPQVAPAGDFKENDWKTNFQQALEVQKSHVAQILSDVKGLSGRVSHLAVRDDVVASGNATLQAVESVRDLLTHQPDTAVDIDRVFKEACSSYERKQDEAVQALDAMGKLTESITDGLAHNYEQLRGELAKLGNGEQVMMQTADSVLDTKRKVEYAVHQIVSEVTQLVKGSAEDISDNLNARFDMFEYRVLDEDEGALSNLTARIAEEIDQVWRQISIMHQQMSESTDALGKLQNQTDVYVNGSLGVMDGMQLKVGQITEKMKEVDDNLNYLVGRLSLVTQEFNNIKTGLGTALDELRAGFKTVENKTAEDKGRGPHPIKDPEPVK